MNCFVSGIPIAKERCPSERRRIFANAWNTRALSSRFLKPNQRAFRQTEWPSSSAGPGGRHMVRAYMPGAVALIAIVLAFGTIAAMTVLL